MLDVRKPLQVLAEEWESCTACELGKRRTSLGAPFIPGTGVKNGIMFVGEAPGEVDESLGVIFADRPGKLLRDVLERLKFTNFYLTNIVGCRACEPVLNADGQPVMRKQFRGPPVMRFRDQVPLPTQIESCRKRLYEEIYIVDPVLIVTLGATASEAVLKRPVSITKERGRAVHCDIPGGTLRAVLTDKKKVWGRKVHGEYTLPTEQNEVRYLVVPTLHPSYVLRKFNDRGSGSPLQQFAEDIRLAVKTYERYLIETTGKVPTSTSDVDIEIEEDQYAHQADV